MPQNPSVAEYVVARIAALGIDKVFGVPGDYAFPWNDAIEASENVEWVGAANELNAAYAADGYARARGAAMLCTTFGPGELSAINGVMGALAESVPIFWLVGLPSSQLRREGGILHHRLRDGDYRLNSEICRRATIASTELTPENAIAETERMIHECLTHRKPVYINVPQDFAEMPVVGQPIVGRPIADFVAPASNPDQLRVAAEKIREVVSAANSAVALPSYLVDRHGLAAQLTEFVQASGIAYATGPMDKAVVSEASDQFLGMYVGIISGPGVKQAVETADLVIDFDVCFSDENTGAWTESVDPAKHLVIGENFVKIGDFHATPVSMADSLAALIELAPTFAAPRLPAPEPEVVPGAGDERVSSAAFYPRLSEFLKPNDIVVSETGLSNLKLAEIRMPEGVTFMNQPLWGSIGWATPCAFGAALADPSRRVVLVTGDGSHQLTANELGVMGRYGVKPIIFLLNNETFGVEELVSNTDIYGHDYNKLAPWNYHEVPAAMGCADWYSTKVRTVAELDAAMAHAATSKSACFIELDLGVEDLPPSLPVPFLNRLYGKTPTSSDVLTFAQALAAFAPPAQE